MKTKSKLKRPITRTEDIHIRVTPTQKQQIQILAENCGLDMTELICTALLEGVIPTISRADPELLRHIAAVGNLTNQVAAACNYCRAADQAVDMALILVELKKISLHLESYVAQIPKKG